MLAEDGIAAWTWLDTVFGPWMRGLPADQIVGIAGNHDFFIEDNSLEDFDLPWTYLLDGEATIDDLRIYGLPWVPNLPGWAFYAQPHQLAAAYQAVPEGTDIVISHGPPKGVLDNGRYHYGTPFANQMIERVKPRFFVCGHVHEGYGREQVGDTEVYNVAHNNIEYEPVNPPVEIEHV